MEICSFCGGPHWRPDCPKLAPPSNTFGSGTFYLERMYCQTWWVIDEGDAWFYCGFTDDALRMITGRERGRVSEIMYEVFAVVIQLALTRWEEWHNKPRHYEMRCDVKTLQELS